MALEIPDGVESVLVVSAGVLTVFVGVTGVEDFSSGIDVGAPSLTF